MLYVSASGATLCAKILIGNTPSQWAYCCIFLPSVRFSLSWTRNLFSLLLSWYSFQTFIRRTQLLHACRRQAFFYKHIYFSVKNRFVDVLLSQSDIDSGYLSDITPKITKQISGCIPLHLKSMIKISQSVRLPFTNRWLRFTHNRWRCNCCPLLFCFNNITWCGFSSTPHCQISQLRIFRCISDQYRYWMMVKAEILILSQ